MWNGQIFGCYMSTALAAADPPWGQSISIYYFIKNALFLNVF
jgi:hypothetical protein